jgi:hypothetical protein
MSWDDFPIPQAGLAVTLASGLQPGPVQRGLPLGVRGDRGRPIGGHELSTTGQHELQNATVPNDALSRIAEYLLVRRDVCDQVWALRSSRSARPQPVGLTGFAGLAAKTGKHRMALRLSGAAEAYRDAYEPAFPSRTGRIWRAGWRRRSRRSAPRRHGSSPRDGR